MTMPEGAVPPQPLALLALRSSALLRRRFGSLVLLGISSRLIESLVVVPVLTIVVAFLVARKGQYSFGNNDILAFALSPTGIFTLLLVATCVVFAQTAEIAALLILGHDRQQGGSPFVRSMWRTFRAAPRIFALAGRECLILAALAVPFLAAIAGVYFSLWTGFDLNYLVQVKPPRFWIGAGIAGALLAIYGAIAFGLFVRWAFAVPEVLFNGQSSLEAMRSSGRIVFGRKRRVVWIAALWVVATVAAHLLVVTALRVLSVFVLGRTRDTVLMAVATSAGLLALHAVAIAAVGFAANAVGAFVLLQLYAGPAPDPDPTEVPAPSWLPTRLGVLAGAAGIAGLAVALSFGLVASLHVDDDILITAHRGAHFDAPENSLPAFEEAVKIGVPWAELDVQLSKDGVVVVAHDEDLRRMVGLNRKVRDMTLAELRQVDFPWATAPKYRGTHVPTLEEIFDAAKDRPKDRPLKIMVEIKVYPGDDTPRLVAETIDLIHRKKFADQCMVISLSYEALEMVRKRDPSLKLAYLVAGSIGNLTRLDVDELSVNKDLATAGLIARARAQGKPVCAWTVDDKRLMVRLWDRGLSNLLTNDPLEMMKEREEVRGMTDVERLLLRARYLLGG